MAVFVSALSLTPVKGTRLRSAERIELTEDGARGDRALFVVDARDRMVNGKQLGELQSVVADLDADAHTLALTFADGSCASAELRYGDPLTARFFSELYPARELIGPWAQALSEQLGQPLRIVAPEIQAVDRGREGAASIISRASLQHLAGVAEQPSVDARRFRMLIEIDGVDAHVEDSWVGRQLVVGEATLLVQGNVGRCLVTSREPESGVIDLPTLDLLGSYRRDVDSTEPLPFGIYARVLVPGAVRVGDSVSADGTADARLRRS